MNTRSYYYMSWIPGTVGAAAAVAAIAEEKENEKSSRKAKQRRKLFYLITFALGVLTLTVVIVLLRVL